MEFFTLLFNIVWYIFLLELQPKCSLSFYEFHLCFHICVWLSCLLFLILHIFCSREGHVSCLKRVIAFASRIDLSWAVRLLIVTWVSARGVGN